MHERDHARELGAVRSGLAATALLCVVELVGGYLTNSLALISDAAHMFTDMAALGLTLFAIWICSRPASETKTFGYYRAEILAALRSEEHTSELQSLAYLVCRLLLEKKNTRSQI